MDRKEAIRDCKKIWAHVAEGRAERKWEALHIELDLFNKYFNSFGCPLCAYTKYKGGTTSAIFPVKLCKKYCPYYLTYKTYCSIGAVNFSETSVLFAKRIMRLEEE